MLTIINYITETGTWIDIALITGLIAIGDLIIREEKANEENHSTDKDNR